MHFTSIQYVLFLWGVFLLYWSLRAHRRTRHALVLAASYWFYAQSDWRFTALLLISSVTDFVAGRRIQDARDAGRRGLAKRWLQVSLAVNLGMLGVFKYFDFFVGSFEAAVESLGGDADLWRLGVVVPVGISFYTFQTLSYTLDIYRGNMKPVSSLLDFALYVSFFPQLVAGPIVRARNFLPQLEGAPELTSERVSSGLFQILRGMLKKVLIADTLGLHLVDLVYRDAGTIEAAGAPLLMLATYGYIFQLYGDFAGYSDIAIGSARLLGFELPKNFDGPYKSRSLEEFWNRWHISMSTWFVDYVYYSSAQWTRRLGIRGGRGNVVRIACNITITWSLIGLWHGAAWTFVLWGLYHAFWLVALRLFRARIPGGKLPDGPVFAFVGWFLTFHVVTFQTFFFRCVDWASVEACFAALGDWSSFAIPIQAPVLGVLALAFVSHFMPDGWQERLERGFARAPRLAQSAVVVAVLLLLFGLRPPGLAPFIYFQF